MPRAPPAPSFRTSALASNYVLSTPPRLRLGAPIVVVAHGRRFRFELGGQSQFVRTPSPTPTEPASSPINPANAGRALRRARPIVEPAELQVGLASHAVSGGGSDAIPSVSELDQEVRDMTPTSSTTTAVRERDDLSSTDGESYACPKK